MFAAGLVSVSFREERPESILREASAAGLSGIEWGGDAVSYTHLTLPTN